MKNFTESFGDLNRRKQYKPLRTTKELASELGLSVANLSRLLGKDGAPKAKLKKNGKTHVSWFDPDEVKKWYKKIVDLS